MNARRRALVAGLSALRFVFALSAARAQSPAAPASEPTAGAVVSVGVYMPSVYFPDSLSRARYAETLARGLENTLGHPVRGRAFGAAGEFQAQVAAGGVDFAAVDAAYALQHGGFEPLAQAQSGGNPARPLIVFTGSAAGSVSALAGQPIVLFDVGASEDRFLSNFVFQGQIGPDYFKRAKPVRDAQAALSVVQLGKARITIGYEGSGGGLSPVFTSRAAPLPVFVRVRAVEPAVAAAVKKAIVGLAAPTEAYDGFGPYNGGGSALTALRSALGSPPGGATTEPVLASPAGNLPPPASHLDPAIPPALVQEPPAADAIFLPPAPADAF